MYILFLDRLTWITFLQCEGISLFKHPKRVFTSENISYTKCPLGVKPEEKLMQTIINF